MKKLFGLGFIVFLLESCAVGHYYDESSYAKFQQKAVKEKRAFSMRLPLLLARLFISKEDKEALFLLKHTRDAHILISDDPLIVPALIQLLKEDHFQPLILVKDSEHETISIYHKTSTHKKNVHFFVLHVRDEKQSMQINFHVKMSSRKDLNRFVEAISINDLNRIKNIAINRSH